MKILQEFNIDNDKILFDMDEISYSAMLNKLKNTQVFGSNKYICFANFAKGVDPKMKLTLSDVAKSAQKLKANPNAIKSYNGQPILAEVGFWSYKTRKNISLGNNTQTNQEAIYFCVVVQADLDATIQKNFNGLCFVTFTNSNAKDASNGMSKPASYVSISAITSIQTHVESDGVLIITGCGHICELGNIIEDPNGNKTGSINQKILDDGFAPKIK